MFEIRALLMALFVARFPGLPRFARNDGEGSALNNELKTTPLVIARP
ncbi:MAG: hypothetical protein WCG04_06385 [Alphaproteobacteria bacterium]